MLNVKYVLECRREGGKRVRPVCQKDVRHQQERYRARVTDYELDQYFSIL